MPQPDELVFGGWFEDGFIFRSGLCYYRGAGKVFYFQPGHEFCRSFYNPYVQRITISHPPTREQNVSRVKSF